MLVERESLLGVQAARKGRLPTGVSPSLRDASPQFCLMFSVRVMNAPCKLFSLDFFGGFGPFQWVTANPNKKIFLPWATLKRASADNFSPSHSVIHAAPSYSRQQKYISTDSIFPQPNAACSKHLAQATS
jgi:hypothetical protein